MANNITEAHQITKKYIFEQKLKGKPITLPWSERPWLEEIKHLKILVKYGLLEEGEPLGSGRYWVRYPIMFHGSNDPARDEKWHELKPGQRLSEPGDLWKL